VATRQRLLLNEANQSGPVNVSIEVNQRNGDAMSKLGLVLGVLLLIGAVATGCGSTTAPSASSSSPPVAMTGGPSAADGPTITISGMAFGDPITASSGATITIVNKDTVEHSVTSDPKGPFDTDVDGGEQKTFTAPTQPGTYPFLCKYHSNMKGTLTVT
jgi:plastocyanin